MTSAMSQTKNVTKKNQPQAEESYSQLGASVNSEEVDEGQACSRSRKSASILMSRRQGDLSVRE